MILDNRLNRILDNSDDLRLAQKRFAEIISEVLSI